MIGINATDLAAIVAAINALAASFATGAAGEAGKATWLRVQKLLGWGSSPEPKNVPDAAKVETEVAAKLESDPALAKELLKVLQGTQGSDAHQPTSWGRLVGHIDAEKVIVIDTNYGSINM